MPPFLHSNIGLNSVIGCQKTSFCIPNVPISPKTLVCPATRCIPEESCAACDLLTLISKRVMWSWPLNNDERRWSSPSRIALAWHSTDGGLQCREGARGTPRLNVHNLAKPCSCIVTHFSKTVATQFAPPLHNALLVASWLTPPLIVPHLSSLARTTRERIGDCPPLVTHWPYPLSPTSTVQTFEFRGTLIFAQADLNFFMQKFGAYSQNSEKFYCLRQVHLAENLLQATHTQNREKTT